MVNLKELWKKVKPGPQNLTHVYLYALTSIAVLALGFDAIKFGLYSEQANSIQGIRRVERQLIRVDRMYSKLLDLQLSSSRRSRKINAREALMIYNEMEAGHEELRNLKFLEGYCDKYPCKDKPFLKLKAVGQPDLRFSGTWTEGALKEVRAHRVFLEQLNKYLDLSTSRLNKNLVLLDISFLGCLLFFLFFQALFIFKPSVARLDHALSVRSEFLSRISHEIRNPMNAILGMAEILKGTKLNIEQKQYLDSLLRAGHTLLEMLNNLIELSAVEGKKVGLRLNPFELVDMVDKTSQVVSLSAHQKGLEFFVKVDSRLHSTYIGDVSRIEQVLINLLNNAIKFTSKGYVLLEIECLSETAQSNFVRISVRDTGIGIDKNKTQDIFGSFVQEDSSIKRQYGGSGLGLSIASDILTLMNSQLKVDSEKGIGSTFYFDLELTTTNVESKAFPEPQLPVLLFTSQHQGVMSSIFRAQGQKNWVCQSESEVQFVLETVSFPVHLIVDDSVGIVNMVSIADQLKNEPKVQEITALLKTSFPKENIDLIRKAGYSQFAHKPFRPWVQATTHMMNEPELTTEIDDLLLTPMNSQKKNLKVLVVDDSEDNLFLLREILNPLVTKIDFARNGQEAIDEVEKSVYDIIFMDIQMPVMDGYTAIRRIRQLDFKNIPIIAVTAHGGVIDEKRCLEAGFSARLVKPIRKDEIVRILDRFFNHPLQQNHQPPKKESPMTHIDPMIIKLLPTFFSTRDKDLGFMEDALNHQDFDQIKALAHKMKGSSLSYGFEEIGMKVKRLESAAVEHDLDLCQKLYEEVSHDLEEEKVRFKDLM